MKKIIVIVGLLLSLSTLSFTAKQKDLMVNTEQAKTIDVSITMKTCI